MLSFAIARRADLRLVRRAPALIGGKQIRLQHERAHGQADALPLASRKSVRASIGRTAAKPDANKKPELALLGLPRERPPTIAALAETRRTRWRGLRKAKG